MNKPTLSVFVIIRDSEFFLRKCLASVREVADELIVINHASIDDSRAIAAEFADKIVDIEDPDYFVNNGMDGLNNLAVSNCTKDWILTVDSDEELVTPDEVRKTIESNDSLFYAVRFKEINYEDMHNQYAWHPEVETTAIFDKHSLSNRRLWKNHIGAKWSGALHGEIITKEGKNTCESYKCSNIIVNHHSYCQMPWYRLRKTRAYSKLLLRLRDEPKIRGATNPYWWEVHVEKQLAEFEQYSKEHELFYEGHSFFINQAIIDLSEYINKPVEEILSEESKQKSTKLLKEKWFNGDKIRSIFFIGSGDLLLPETAHWHFASRGIKRYMKIIKTVTQGKDVLDFGCGIGTYSLELAKLGFNVTAYDITPQLLEFSKWRAKKYNMNIEFNLGDYKIALSKKYDTIVCLETLGFVENPITILKDLASALNLSGLLLLTYQFNDSNGKIPHRGQSEETTKEFEEIKNKLFWVMGSKSGNPQILIKRR